MINLQIDSKIGKGIIEMLSRFNTDLNDIVMSNDQVQGGSPKGKYNYFADTLST